MTDHRLINICEAGGNIDTVDLYNSASSTQPWTTSRLSLGRWHIAAASVGLLAVFAGGYASTGMFFVAGEFFSGARVNSTLSLFPYVAFVVPCTHHVLIYQM